MRGGFVVVVVVLALLAGCAQTALLTGAPQAQSASCGAPGVGGSFSSAGPAAARGKSSGSARVDDEPECRMSTNGRQACGYNCKMGTDGVYVCADTPNGRCAMGTDGRVTCSQLRQGARADDPPPECRMGTDGKNTCGYNCRMGTNGRYYCASTPNGRCAMNTDGTFTCS